VEEDGAGSPVLFIHGLGGTSNTFTPQAAALAGRFRLIRPDLPGSGRSPLGEERLSITTLVAAMLRVLDALAVPRAAVVGHSLGTIVAQHLAVAHPARVAALALLGTLTEPPEAARAAMRARAATAREQGMAGIADAVAQGGLAAATRQESPLAVAFVRESLMRQTPEGYAATCEALADAQAAEAARIGVPTLVMTGADDATAPPSVARLIAGRIAGARAEIIPRCGHWPSIERPAEVQAALASFLPLGAR
jgi:3-oxoadipate enol-lactonase